MTKSPSVSLYDQIGPALIRSALTEFYIRAFTDGIIGHFFFNKDREAITEKQIAFATAMLGGPRHYKGLPLGTAHGSLKIRKPHFDRRQVLLDDVLTEFGLAQDLRQAWLVLEESLRPVIIPRKL